MPEHEIDVATGDRPEAAPSGAAGPGSGSLRRERRAAARAQGVVDLLHRRPDLAGTYLPADLTAEAVRWSA
jgi:hypothetical protein